MIMCWLQRASRQKKKKAESGLRGFIGRLPSSFVSITKLFFFSVTFVFVFNYFSNIIMFKTTIPTANPFSIQSFPISQLHHHSLPMFDYRE
jgi:hypothetical protein